MEERWNVTTGLGDEDAPRVRLDEGRGSGVPSAVTTAVARARPVADRPDVFALEPGLPGTTVSALVSGGLAGYDEGTSGWCLTLAGTHLRSALVPDVPGHHVDPRGVSVHPELSRDDRDRLVAALARESGGEGADHGVAARDPDPRSVVESTGALVILLVALMGVLSLILLFAPEVFGPLSVAAGLAGAGAVHAHLRGRASRAREEAERAPDAVEELQGRFVTGDMLDAPARWMLGRAQRAVDAVLDSAPHQRGLLLDEVRNRVVLADVEWGVAQSLLRQSRTRQRIDTTPVTGQRSGEAARRARAALQTDVTDVERRVRTLEDYASRVHAAELEEQDRRSAAELDAIADSTVEAGAAHPHQEESLSHLVRAQALALRLAALSDDTDHSAPHHP